MSEQILLDVALDLINGAFVQVPEEQREEVGGEEQGLH